jgi:hypothetical protein
MRNHLEKLFQCEKCHKHVWQENQELLTKHAKDYIQINKLRDRKQIIPELVQKSNIVQGEVVIYLDDAGTKHLILLVIPKKSHIPHVRGD